MSSDLISIPNDLFQYPDFRVNTIDRARIIRPAADILVVDDVYADPMAVRRYALGMSYDTHHSIYDSQCSLALVGNYPPLIYLFENLLGFPLSRSETATNGAFQYVTAEVVPVVHADLGFSQAAVLFLCPDAPPDKGIGFFRHRVSGLDRYPSAQAITREIGDQRFRAMVAGETQAARTQGSHLERWQEVLRIDNRFNRLVLFSADRFHSGLGGFGGELEDARLYQTFFYP